MAESITPTHKPDVTFTGLPRVVCSGPATGRHPQVYLSLEKDVRGRPHHVVCPYCSHVFQFSASLAGTGGH